LEQILKPSFWGQISVQQTLVLLVYLLAIRNVIKILRDELNPPSASAWILVNLALPFIGVPLYYFLGQNKLKSYLKRRKETRQYLSSIQQARELKGLIKPTQSAALHDVNSPFHQPPTLNDLEILNHGQTTFDEIFAAVKAAQTFILVQYYILRPDTLGQQFKDLLIERAQAGVKIFLLFDNLGSVGLTGKYIRDLKRNGVEVARFLPFQFRFHLQINFRNHRKLVLVDGHTGFVGGMNVGNEYLGKKRVWRDTQLKIQGPALTKLAETFLDDWNFAVGKRRQYMPGPFIYQCMPQKEGRYPTRAISFGPGDQLEIGLYLFMHLLQSAEKSLVIATPYFIPDIVLERCLEMAMQKGIEVTLLVPYKADHWYVGAVNSLYIRRFARAGGRVYRYHKGFMHQKVLLVDQRIAVIGTSNFDNRSIYLNFETCIVVHDEDFGQNVHAMLQQDLTNSTPLDLNKAENAAYLMLANLARLFAPLF
jgi:cardiolipin synthase